MVVLKCNTLFDGVSFCMTSFFESVLVVLLCFGPALVVSLYFKIVLVNPL